MSRKTSFTPELGQVICRSIRLGCTVEATAKIAGVATQTIYNWLERGAVGKEGDEQFSQFLVDYEKAEGEIEQTFNASILAAARGTTFRPGDWRAGAWWLERRRAKQYREQSAVEVSAGEVTPEKAAQLIREGFGDHAVKRESSTNAGPLREDPPSK